MNPANRQLPPDPAQNKFPIKLTHEFTEAMLLDDPDLFFDLLNPFWDPSKDVYFDTQRTDAVEACLRYNPPVPCVCARYGAIKILKRLAAVGVNLTKTDSKKARIFHYAALGDHVKIITWLKSQIQNELFFEADARLMTLIHWAAEADAYNVMMWTRSMFQLEHYDARSHLGKPVQIAAERRAFRCFEFLARLNLEFIEQHPTKPIAEFPIDFNEESLKPRHTPLAALTHKGGLDMIALGLPAGMLLDRDGPYDWSALYWACAEGRADVAECLLNFGASVNTRCKHGWTPLHAAAMGRHADVCKLLLERGAVPHVFTEMNKTPFLLARPFAVNDRERQTAKILGEYSILWFTKMLMLRCVIRAREAASHHS